MRSFPVVWIHTPYRRAYTDPKGDVVNPLERLGLMPLLKYGYVVAAVDTRGRGASFGARRGFQDRTEARDAYEMTEWFASQPWSTGDIGVAGCSYLGGSTWHAATIDGAASESHRARLHGLRQVWLREPRWYHRAIQHSS